MAKQHLYLLSFGLLLLSACKKDEVAEVDLGYGYFPTKVGTWVEYEVDSLWLDDPSNVRDSVHYLLREQIMDEYTDLEGRLCQRIHRFVKDAEGNWVVRDVWTSTTSTIAAEKTEEDERRLKLSFPVNNGRTWDINVFNTVNDLSVAYRNEGEPWSANGLNYENTVLVKNIVPANVIVKRNFEERYADGVGMVSKYWEETNTQFTIDGQLSIVGWRLDMVAIAYGISD